MTCRKLGPISSTGAGCDGRLLSPKKAWSCATRLLVVSEMCASVDACSPDLARPMQWKRLSRNTSILSWREHLLERMVLNQVSCWTQVYIVSFHAVPVLALASCSTGTDVRREQEPEAISDGELMIMFSPCFSHTAVAHTGRQRLHPRYPHL